MDVIYTPNHTHPGYMQYMEVIMEYLNLMKIDYEPTLFNRCTNVNQVKKELKKVWKYGPPPVKTTKGRITQGTLNSNLVYIVKDLPTDRYWFVKERYNCDWKDVLAVVDHSASV